MRDGTAEPVSRDQILRHARGQGNVHFPSSADHEQDWQPYPVDPYSAICDDHTYIHCSVRRFQNLWITIRWEKEQNIILPRAVGAHQIAHEVKMALERELLLGGTFRSFKPLRQASVHGFQLLKHLFQTRHL